MRASHSDSQMVILMHACHAARWKKPAPSQPGNSLMDAILTQYDFRQERLWVWIGMAISVAWIIGLNILVLFSMELFNRMLLHPLRSCSTLTCALLVFW